MASKVNLTDKKFKEVYNLLDKYIDKNAAAAFKKAREEGTEIAWLNKRWARLEGYTPWINAYSSIEDLTLSPTKLMEQIYSKYPDLSNISKARMKNILDNNDVTEEQLKAYYLYRQAQSKQMDAFNESRYKDLSNQHEQIERSKDDSYYNSPLANEYARDAHIKGDPHMAAYNEVVGKVAGAADFAPFPGSLLGPGLRTVQKAYAGEPIVTLGTLADVAGSVIPDFAEKPAQMAYNYGKGFIERFTDKLGDTGIGKAIEARILKADAKKASELAKSDKNIIDKISNDGIKDKNGKAYYLTDKDYLNYYNEANDPLLKSKIEAQFKARGELNKAQRVADHSMVKSNPEGKEAALSNLVEAEGSVNKANQEFISTAGSQVPSIELKAGDNKLEVFDNKGKLNSYYNDVPLSEISTYEASKVTPSLKADGLYNVLQFGGRKAARTGIGGRLGQWDTFDPVPEDKSDKLVDEAIKLYGDTWSPMIKPDNYDDPLIQNAYDKWMNDPKREYNEEEYMKKLREQNSINNSGSTIDTLIRIKGN